jgi:hypothetical protein
MARICITAPDGRKHIHFTPVELPHLTVRYKDGCGYTVKEAWATQLEFLGQAVRVAVPPRRSAQPAAPKPAGRGRTRRGAARSKPKA